MNKEIKMVYELIMHARTQPNQVHTVWNMDIHVNKGDVYVPQGLIVPVAQAAGKMLTYIKDGNFAIIEQNGLKMVLKYLYQRDGKLYSHEIRNW